MKKFLAASRGEEPADFVIKGARVANVFTLEYESVDVAVCGDRIVGVGEGYEGKEVIDGGGKTLIPGMIDGHVHIESSMLAPPVFADQAVSHGTTAIMADPHEIANVLGMKGIEYMFNATRGLPVDVFLGAPPCVPASNFESPFEKLEMKHISEMYERGWCHHLAEMMNFPGIINGDEALWKKLQAAGKTILTGHAPALRGKELCAYMLGGISSDHESVGESEALEKLRRGMWLMMRAGSTAPNLNSLVSIVKRNLALSARCMAVSDDVTAKDLVYKGHMDAKIRMMAQEGLDPLIALRMVTLSPANYFELKDRGAIGPGLLADMVLVDNLDNCRVDKVWKNGALVVEDGKLLRQSPIDPDLSTRYSSVRRAAPLTSGTIRVGAPPEGTQLRVINIEEGAVMTGTRLIAPVVRDGFVTADAEKDIAKIVVRERHNGTGRFAIGFVSGMGMTGGAIASSVAHDAHNFVAVGMDDQSIITALSVLEKNGGGLAVADHAEEKGYLALPIAGLMTTLDAASTALALDDMETLAVSVCGADIANPFMKLSFLSLSVIPELKITDRGYVDISKGGTCRLFSNA